MMAKLQLKYWLFPIILLGATLAGACTTSAQPAPSRHLLYFDEPIGFQSFRQLTVYRAWEDPKSFFLLPTGVSQEAEGFSFHYKHRHDGKLEGTLVLNIRPVFDEDELKSVSDELKRAVADGQFIMSEPSMSEWQIIGSGISKTVTPALMSNPLLSSTAVSLEIPDDLSRILLHSGSNYASAFVVRHKFAIRGIELDDSMSPHVTTRWFNRGVSFPGSCGVSPERYIDIKTGRAGCLYEITFSKNIVKDAQTMLRHLNIYHGPIDGVAGTKTRLAIRAFQAKQSLLEDGEISSTLLVRLREAS